MPLQKTDELTLRIFAEEIRVTAIRSIAAFGEGHVGGTLSIADLLAALYGRYIRVDPHDPHNPERDKLVLSKGHCGPALYAALAQKGFFPMEALQTLNRFGTILPSHCDRLRTPGVDMSTGSLGQGASAAAGIALADKMCFRDSYTYLIIGDGECNEGQIWEMAMFAKHQNLDHLITFVDRNHQQLDGYTDDICRMGDLEKIFRAYGWYADTVDGNDMKAVCGAIEAMQSNQGAPSVIVLDTVKGKGWADVEKRMPSHYMTVTPQQLAEYEAISAARLQALRAELDTMRGKAGV